MIKNKNITAMLVLLIISVIGNAAALISSDAVDLYDKYIFHYLSSVFAFLSGLIPFSFGELLIALGILCVILLPFLIIIPAVKKNRKMLKGVGIFYGWVLVFIIFTETFACFTLYHTTEFSQKYHNNAGAEGFTSEQLVSYCEELILKADELAEIVSRDEKGNMIIPEDMDRIAYESMNRLAVEYPLLEGYYPRHKKITCSMLMTQMDLQGIYFPFTMESNINRELSPARVPCTVMHEQSHLKGFIREDESCYIACRACWLSDSPEVQYSGYLSAMNYTFGEARKYASEEDIYHLRCLISQQVGKDNIFVSEEFRKKVEEKAVIPTEKVTAVSEKAMDTTLKVGGITDGKKSYNRMVSLLLEYRYCISENE